MKTIYCFFCLCFLLTGWNAEAANRPQSAFRALPQSVSISADSLFQTKVVKNKPASSSLIIGSLAAFLGVLGIATIGTLEFGFLGVLLGGILGLVALISGAVGLDRRKRILQTNPPSSSEANTLDLGRRKANAGILLGLIGIIVLIGLFVIIAS